MLSGINYNKLRIMSTVFKLMVTNQRMKASRDAELQIEQRIQSSSTLCEKCILAREYINPQSTLMEKVIKSDLQINNPPNETSGDGEKNGKNYEIKFSAHDKTSKFNFVQIRPDHQVDFYILIGYNLFEDEIGKAYNFKIPSADLYALTVEYGGYAHGTCKELGKITTENFKGRNCEYALRVNPNANEKTKARELWNKLAQFITPYDKDSY